MNALLLSQYKHLEMQLYRFRCQDRQICWYRWPRAGSAAATFMVTMAPLVVAFLRLSWGTRLPAIVAAVGSEVSGFAVGDRVTFDSTVYCGVCEFCRKGEMNLCDNRQVVGVSCGDYRRAGAFAEYVAVPARIAYKLPENLASPEAAMLEAVSVALHAVAVSKLKGGETALVIGAGMIGLLTLQAARAAGCSRVFVADIDATRLKSATELGADKTILASGAELTQEILRVDRRSRRGCRVGGRWSKRDDRRGHRLRAKGRHRNADRQHYSAGQSTAAKSCFATDTVAGIVCVVR